MVRRKYKIGIFVSDASFDFKTKVASIGIINLVTKEAYNINCSVKNPMEAESFGILESLKKGIGLYENIIVFCDNINSVNKIRKTVLSSNYWKSKFKYIQIVWIPREETYLADFFSKNLEKETDNLKEKIKSFEKKCENNVIDIVVSDKDKKEILKKFKKNIELKFLNIKNFNFKSNILKNIFNNNNYSLSDYNIEEMREDFLLLIEKEPEVAKDLKKIINGILNF
jgi:hypothetical protein